MSASLYADAFPVESDKEGRILLPAELVEHAALSSQVVLHGHGRHLPDLGAGRRRPAPDRGP